MKESKISNKLVKIITIPKRAFAKAIDLYVKSMNSYADHACYAGGFGVGGLGFAVVEPLPHNFSANSLRSTAEFDDLIGAASSRAACAQKLDLGAPNQHRLRPDFQKSAPPIDQRRSRAVNARVPRSPSVAMAKIDEDEACEFGADDCGEGIQRQGACFGL